jgi:hypothetical protein
MGAATRIAEPPRGGSCRRRPVAILGAPGAAYSEAPTIMRTVADVSTAAGGTERGPKVDRCDTILRSAVISMRVAET